MKAIDLLGACAFSIGGFWKMRFLFILIYLAIIIAVIEINVMIFIFTGLDKHISRFQVISMLTGTGFTTGESELIIGHPIRRRVGAFLIFFGAFSLAVVISVISSILSDDFLTKEIAYVAGALTLLLFILKVPSVTKRLARVFKGELEKNFDLQDLPIRDVFLTDKNDYFVDVPIPRSSEKIGKSLKEVIIDEDDINILLIKRGEVIIRKNKLETDLQEGDAILVYGDKEILRNKFKHELEKDEDH
jgi:hypothetical protein